MHYDNSINFKVSNLILLTYLWPACCSDTMFLEPRQITNSVAMSVNMFVSVSPVIILAACTRCFNAFCPEHDGMDSRILITRY